MGEAILGDAESAAFLENMGQSAQVELLLDQGMRANTRAAQRPYMNALAQIVDGMGLYERDVEVFDTRIQEVGRSMLALRNNLSPEQLPELTQLFHAAGRASDRSGMSPSAALEELQGVEERVLTLSQEAGDRLRDAYIIPMEKMQVEYEAARGQLISSSGGNMDAEATPQEVMQILNLVGTQTTQELAGLGVTTPFGQFGPDDVPNLTYAELLNTINSRENSVTELTKQVLEERGFTELETTPLRIRPTRRTDLLRSQNAVNDALENTDFSGSGDALQRFVSQFPEGSQIDAGQNLIRLPNGTAEPITGQALAILQRQRTRGRIRRERMNTR